MSVAFHVGRQPDDESCGITCLKAIYDHYSVSASLEELKRDIVHLPAGGTVAVNLARHALANGFDAVVYDYNLAIFDPTWKGLSNAELERKLLQRRHRLGAVKAARVIGYYLEYLRWGGRLAFDDLDESLMDRLFRGDALVIVGLSATYLYRLPRETDDNLDDDIGGNPVGHFVVAGGWDPATRTVGIHDPLPENPLSESGRYRLPFTRFCNAVMLGALTCDDTLLAITRRST